MNFEQEIKQLIEDCVNEGCKDDIELLGEEFVEVIDEIKTTFFQNMINENLSDSDKNFVLNNLPLYKKIIIAMIKEDPETLNTSLSELSNIKKGDLT
jgi:hypothetical protein